MASTATRAVIVGAGIGGTAAAVALRRAGIEATAFERGQGGAEVGSGFFVWANGIRALQRLGLAEHVEALGARVERSQYLTWRGNVLVEWPVGEVARRLGAVNVGIPRSDLQRVLAEAAGDGVRLGRECTGFEQDGSGVTVRFADGGSEQGDVLIGADGFESRIAEELGVQTEPRYGGHSVFRAVVRFEHEQMPAGTFRQHLGPGVQFLYLPVGQGRVYWAASESVARRGRPPAAELKPWLLEAFTGFTEPIEAMIEAAEENEIRWLEIFDREPKSRWGESRATLLGDAAHAMLPTMAQGACQALEDAIVLAACLADGQDPADALRAYEARRIERATNYVLQSRKLARIGGIRNPLVVALRNRMLKRVMARMIPRRERELAAMSF